MPFGSNSISLITDDPVVVKPETVSKKASAKFVIELLRMYGKVPNMDIKSHERVTIKKLSFIEGFIGNFDFVIRKNAIPNKKVITDDSSKGINVPSLNIIEIGISMKKNKLSMIRHIPITCIIIEI
jgi:hypothetical protein